MCTVKGLRGFPCRMTICGLSVAFLLGSAGCGGSSGSTTVVVPPPAISLSITSHPVGVNAGLTYHFFASVLHTRKTVVNWSVGCSCPGADIGTVLSDGAYIAPPSVLQPVTLIVTATSAADPTKVDSARFTLMPAVQISMDPAPSQRGQIWQV